ncbi:MAG: sigma-70 family RNA polymerase sigma factor [Sedimentisphaerales bacterium]|nr:sigma-70 family RNA polymerase sigma factor [Sedimentisphaerales bacterium]
MDSSSELESAELIEEARTNYNAFSILYRRHYDALFKYCVHRLFDRHLAEDITSQVFLRVVEKFNTFRGTEKQFRGWLYVIATNFINEHLRKAAVHKKAENYLKENPQNHNNNIEDKNAKLESLKNAIHSLKPKYQTIITLYYFEKMKTEQIAETLGTTPATIRSQLSRGAEKLRKKMNIKDNAFLMGGEK